MEPTVFTDVEDHMYIAQEESFGPVMVISKFKNGYVLLWLPLGTFSFSLCSVEMITYVV